MTTFTPYAFPQIPFAFTEYGAVMAANILNSLRATQISVLVVRTFVKIREMVVANKELLAKLAELERRLDSHDESIRSLVAAIRELMTPAPEPPPRRRIGFA